MILFVYGPETYLVRQKLGQIVSKAKGQGVDAFSAIDLDANEIDLNRLREELTAQSFFAEKRLILVRDWLANRSAKETQQLLKILPQVSDKVILVFSEYGQPDRRLSGFKGFQKLAAKTWEFPDIDEAYARRLVGRKADSLELHLTPQAVTGLIAAVGLDAWALSTELEKLSSSEDAPEITEQTVERLVVSRAQGDIFSLVDALSRRDTPQAAKMLQELRESGEPPLRVLAMIVRQYRVLMGVKSFGERGFSESAMAKQLGVHPYGVKKARSQSSAYTGEELKDIYRRLEDIDFFVKTGRGDADVLLDVFVMTAGVPAEGRLA